MDCVDQGLGALPTEVFCQLGLILAHDDQFDRSDDLFGKKGVTA